MTRSRTSTRRGAGTSMLFAIALLTAATLSAQQPRPIPEPPPSVGQGYKGFRVGRYEGPVFNKTGNANGKGQFDLRSIGGDGAVKAYLREYDGLEGEGDLTGAINAQGVMHLQGGLTSPSNGEVWQSEIIAVMLNGNLRLGTRLSLNGKLQEESATMAYNVAPTPVAQPARTVEGGGGIPIGVYLRTPDLTDVEAWYFGPNGRVVRGMQGGFTQAGLAAHKPRWRGTYQLNGTQMIVTADDGTTDRYVYKLDKGRHVLDEGWLSAVAPATNPQLLVGEYFHNGGSGSLRTANTLTLRADGSYVRSGVGLYRADGQSYGGTSDETGTWQYATHTLTFRAQDGTVQQQLALIPPPGSFVAAMGQLFVGGKLFRRKQ